MTATQLYTEAALRAIIREELEETYIEQLKDCLFVYEIYTCDPQRLTVITEQGDFVSAWQSHFATCPQAGQFRRGGTR